ncbi:nuclear transport factor 2 family protein [Chitinophaga sp. sic0106]|uniref:nuclear transport factor 2 family protein n=1 Tax=Chitinophaga sp. sic0106 TaxID=2854785 RepID=UPI001C44045E|nr:nuclear transport factor 2 family protein [Chitinophaga sp. sic0106]MBV7531662.1 nuclear transport factor 2 family protein [Chitinophaga sp. sic0106]
MTDKQAFGQAWVAAWNSHDIEEILSHYAEDITFYSPVVQRINNEPSGRLSGKVALREYFLRGLAAYPDLHFELYHILEGVDSVVLHYKSINNSLSAELMVLNEEGLVKEVRAHYKPQ